MQPVGWIILMSCFALAADQPGAGGRGEALKKLQGLWMVESILRDPPENGPGEGKGIRCVIKSDRVTVEVPDDTRPGGGLRITIDAAKAPKTMDLKGDGETDPVLGVYELKDDILRVSLAPVGKPRPAAIDSPRGSGQSVVVLKRAKP